ncbi:MAG: methyltransferase, FxLD system, partial [Pseudonocardiaceae bacterium]
RGGLDSPMFPTVAMATTTEDGSLAYLTIRRAEPAPDGGKLFEVGVIGHGPTGQRLAEHVGQHIDTWDTGFRARRVRFAIPDTPPAADPDQGQFVLHRPHHPITVTWE